MRPLRLTLVVLSAMPFWFTVRPAIVMAPVGAEMMPLFVAVPAPVSTRPTHTSIPRRLGSFDAWAAIAT